MPVHNRCNEIKNRSFICSSVQLRRHAVHVPRRVPRPCPCTTGVMKSTTDHLSEAAEAHRRQAAHTCPCTTGVMKSTTDHLSAVTHAAEAATQETHCSCTRHVPRRVPRPCPCTTNVQLTTENTLSCTRHVPRRVPRPCPCTTCKHRRQTATGDTLQLH